MLRFFRSIRQQLLAENKTVKYLKYAVGEFLLIVAGILVALQIQNWNEGRKQAQKRVELIEDLQADFIRNLDRLQVSILEADTLNDGLAEFLKIASSEENHLSLSELRQLATNAHSPIRFQPAISAYKTAISSGSFLLIKNKAIKELFVDFQDALTRFEKLRDINREEQLMGNSVALRSKFGSIWNIQEPGTMPENYVLSEKFKISLEDYRDLISQAEVFSIYENKFEIRLRMQGALENLSAINQKILTALETL